MRKIVPLVIGLLFIGSVFAATTTTTIAAIPTPPLKVGVLDIDQLMAKTNATDRAMKKILKQYEPQGKALEKEEEAFRHDVKKYNAISDKLRPDEIKQWQHKLNTAQEQLLQKQSILQDKIMAAEELATQKIISYYFTLVTKVAEKNHLTLVFFKDITTYNLPGVAMQDITNQIIKMSMVKKKVQRA